MKRVLNKYTLAFHGLVIDEQQHIVLREDRKLEFAGTEFEILNLCL